MFEQTTRLYCPISRSINMPQPIIGTQKEWFGQWFDSPYYHILYQHRDDSEAKQFVNKLVNHLHLPPQTRILDVACGRGRHAVYLNQKGFDVTGIDLSAQNIAFAKRKQNGRLHFVEHDMRTVFALQGFDLVLNLFTSFGYFDDEVDNFRTIEALAKNLRAGGQLVIDFFNADWVLAHQLTPYELKKAGGICFEIRKEVKEGFIVKNIDFEANNQRFHFEERVRLLTLTDFMAYFSAAGLALQQLFGNYQLDAYQPSESQRLIFVLTHP